MLRSAGDLGLAHRAGRLGHVAMRSSTDLVERIWTLPWVPFDWHVDQIQELLAPYFENIKMLRQLRKKKFKVFYFRAASKEADRDLVPLTARDGTDTLTLWATIAPPRNRVRQQRVLKGSSVLSLAPRTSIFEPQPVPVATGAEKGEDGDKEQGVAKKAKTLARGVPTGCKVHIMPSDGSCVFHAFAAGLGWLHGPEKSPPHARELRAGVVTHLLQHKDRYAGLWDKCDTQGKSDPNLDFEGYCKLVGRESAYASDLELRALARSWQVNIVVVPADSRLEPEAFTTQKAKKTLAFWLENKHVDLLLPVEGSKYPEELLAVRSAPSFGFRAGGKSVASVCSKPGTEWSSVAPSRARSLCRKPPTEWSSGGSRAGVPVAADQAEVPAQVPEDAGAAQGREVQGIQDEQDLQGYAFEGGPQLQHCKPKAVQRNLLFRCEYCAFSKRATTQRKFNMLRYVHCKRYHGGDGLPGQGKVKLPECVVPLAKGTKGVSWRCPLCTHGITDKRRAGLSVATYQRAKRRHRDEHHAKVPLPKWYSLNRDKRRDGAAKLNHRALKGLALTAEAKTKGYVTFLWPRPREHCKSSKRIKAVRFATAWSCVKCGLCFTQRKKFGKHGVGGNSCTKNRAACSRQWRLNELGRTEAWCRGNMQVHGYTMPMLDSIFVEARRALQGGCASSPCSSQ